MAVLANIGESCWSVISFARPAGSIGGFSDSAGRAPSPSSVSGGSCWKLSPSPRCGFLKCFWSVRASQVPRVWPTANSSAVWCRRRSARFEALCLEQLWSRYIVRWVFYLSAVMFSFGVAGRSFVRDVFCFHVGNVIAVILHVKSRSRAHGAVCRFVFGFFVPPAHWH